MRYFWNPNNIWGIRGKMEKEKKKYRKGWVGNFGENKARYLSMQLVVSFHFQLTNLVGVWYALPPNTPTWKLLIQSLTLSPPPLSLSHYFPFFSEKYLYLHIPIDISLFFALFFSYISPFEFPTFCHSLLFPSQLSNPYHSENERNSPYPSWAMREPNWWQVLGGRMWWARHRYQGELRWWFSSAAWEGECLLQWGQWWTVCA